MLFCRPEDRAALSSVGENLRPVAETARNYSVGEQFRIPLALRREGEDVGPWQFLRLGVVVMPPALLLALGALVLLG